MDNNQEKKLLQEQFDDLFRKAKENYEDIEDTISTFNEICHDSEDLNSFLELNTEDPIIITSNTVC